MRFPRRQLAVDALVHQRELVGEKVGLAYGVLARGVTNGAIGAPPQESDSQRGDHQRRQREAPQQFFSD
jgi:hypothetical protein